MNNKENELKDNGHTGKKQNQQHLVDAAINFNADDSLAGTTHLNDELASEEDDRIQKLTEELKEANDKYLRLAAEFDNYRKRNAKERNELIKSAGEDVIKSLLDILDDSERAAQQLELSDDIKTNKEGVFLVFNKLKNVLQGRGLKAMESREQEFNPELHEAITEIPAPTEALQGKVLDEVQKGYFLNDKIIRHAKVVVGK